jgi:hypothetical protein
MGSTPRPLRSGGSAARWPIFVGRKSIRYRQTALVVADESTPVSRLCDITCAPRITAPEGSETSPVIEPVTLCPIAIGMHRPRLNMHPANLLRKCLLIASSLRLSFTICVFRMVRSCHLQAGQLSSCESLLIECKRGLTGPLPRAERHEKRICITHSAFLL